MLVDQSSEPEHSKEKSNINHMKVFATISTMVIAMVAVVAAQGVRDSFHLGR